MATERSGIVSGQHFTAKYFSRYSALPAFLLIYGRRLNSSDVFTTRAWRVAWLNFSSGYQLSAHKVDDISAECSDVLEISTMALSNDLERYQYTTLDKPDSIRLLELLPGTNDSLRCRLVVAKLSQKPIFEALSYTWGKHEFVNRIEEISSQLPLYITENLKNALQALRNESTSRMLWVDAVCINQSDDMEKGWQVNMMKDIYQGATKVIVWLGKQADDPGVAEIEMTGFEELERIGRNCSLYGFDKIFPPFPRTIADQSALEHLKELARSGGVGLLGVYHREWYERVWIVQEFILATDLIFQFGSYLVSYDIFSKATAVLQLMGRRRILAEDLATNTKGLILLFFDRHFSYTWQLIQQRERYWGNHATQYSSSTTGHQLSAHTSIYAYEDPIIRPSSLIEYCAFARNLKCSIEIDRLYGLLGFAHDSLSIQPDYSSTPEKIWEMLAVKTLLLGDLTVLHYAGVPATGVSRVRSFAADFGRCADSTVRLGGHGHPRFHAATQIPAKVELEEDGCVRVHAIKVDTVNQVSFVSGENEDPSSPMDADAMWNVRFSGRKTLTMVSRDVLKQLNEWWTYSLAVEGPRFYSDTIGKRAFPRTIIADNALPAINQNFAQFPMEHMDLLFAIFILAEESTDDTGNTKSFVNPWKVYEWMGKPMKFIYSPFPDDENPAVYHFPSTGGLPEEDDVFHYILSKFGPQGVILYKEEIELSGVRDHVDLDPPPQLQERIIEITNPLKEVLDLYITAVSSILSQHYIFSTNVRLLGIGPKSMQPGDVIMVPKGSQTPFVYRRVKKDEEVEDQSCVRRGKLIGECYIHGLMDGNPVEKLEENYDGSHIEVILE